MTRINKRQAQALAFAAMSVISLGVGLSSRLQPSNPRRLASKSRGMKDDGQEQQDKPSHTENTDGSNRIRVEPDGASTGSDPDQSQTSLLMVEEETKAIRKFVVQVLMTEQSHQLKEILKIETQLSNFQGFATIGFVGLVIFFVLLAAVDHPAMFAPICLFLAGFTGFQVGALQRTNKLQNKVKELLDGLQMCAHSMLKEGTCGGPRNFAPIALSKFLNNEEQTAGALNEALNQKAISDNISMELAVRIIRRCVTLRQVRRYCRDNEVLTPHT